MQRYVLTITDPIKVHHLHSFFLPSVSVFFSVRLKITQRVLPTFSPAIFLAGSYHQILSRLSPLNIWPISFLQYSQTPLMAKVSITRLLNLTSVFPVGISSLLLMHSPSPQPFCLFRICV